MCRQLMTAKWLGPAEPFHKARRARRWSVGGVAKCVTGTPRDGRDVEARVDPLAWDGVCQGRGLESSGTWFALLISRRSQVQILPPLPTSSQVRGPFPLGEGLLHVWPVTRSETRLLTSDVSVVPLRLRRNAEL